jgi:hypothetical protein
MKCRRRDPGKIVGPAAVSYNDISERSAQGTTKSFAVRRVPCAERHLPIDPCPAFEYSPCHSKPIRK